MHPSRLGLLTVNRLPVLKGWTGYKLSGPHNRSDLALIVRLLQQVCRRHKVTSDDLDHTHTHYNLLRPTSAEWVDHTLCGPHTTAPWLPLSVCLSVSLSLPRQVNATTHTRSEWSWRQPPITTTLQTAGRRASTWPLMRNWDHQSYRAQVSCSNRTLND